MSEPTDPAVDKPVENPVEDLVDRRVDGLEDVDNVVDTRTGPALARAVLEAAQARHGAAGAGPADSHHTSRHRGSQYRSRGDHGQRGAARRRGWSGSGPDPRDPQPFGVLMGKLLRDRGWQQPAAEATIFGRWEHVVGAQVAEHSRPVKLTRGELTVEATSTAWATQLRLLARSLLRQIGQQVGHGVVTRLHIHGPAAPSWQPGPRRVRGAGPRDTYG